MVILPLATEARSHPQRRKVKKTFIVSIGKHLIVINVPLEDMASLSSALGINSRPSSVSSFGWSFNSPQSLTPKPIEGPLKFEPDTYSRKVFVGGLPPDIDEGERLFI